MAKLDTDRPCPQHHQPRSECRPSDRHVRTMRFRDDDWENAEEAAWAGKSDVTTRTMLAMNAMSGYIRCYRCREDAPPVPVQTGDLTGRALGEWITDAEKTVVAQHPRHEPVTIGRTLSQTVPATPEPLLRARARAGGTPPVVFMEPGEPR